MAVTTTQATVTKSWTKLSDGNCILQAEVVTDYYNIAVGEAAPDGDAKLSIKLDKPKTFGLDTAVWCRLSSNSLRDSSVINIIK